MKTTNRQFAMKYYIFSRPLNYVKFIIFASFLFVVACSGDDTSSEGVVEANSESINAVSNLLAVPGDEKIVLSWTNSTGSFDRIVLLRKSGSAVSGPEDADAEIIYSITDNFKGTTHTDESLTNGMNYHYAVYSHSDRLGYSTPVLTTASPASAPPASAPTPSSSYRLPDTGQSESYTDTSGEDHDYTINPPSYTDNGDTTITDNNTTLMWEKSPTHGPQSGAAAKTICENSTTGSHADWRLPSLEELTNIVDFGKFDGWSLDATYFSKESTSSTSSIYYWTSTSVDSSSSWSVDFGGNDGGNDVQAPTSSQLYVRCVRGGTSFATGYVDNGNSVTDQKTGLTWEKMSAEPKTTDKKTWGNALTYCEDKTHAGQSDWRLPNIKELESIVNYGNTPAIYSAVSTNFPSTSPNFWSSTTIANASGKAWFTQFETGERDVVEGVKVITNNAVTMNYALCVRGNTP